MKVGFFDLSKIKTPNKNLGLKFKRLEGSQDREGRGELRWVIEARNVGAFPL